MATQHFILATAGHVDHGKSALVKALTGTDPDRLPEEKARGITIDLGFAHLELPAPSTLHPHPPAVAPACLSISAAGRSAQAGPSTFLLGIVDVPGHEDFVKNMVAGVGSIDLALFVVAADDGWMPQTEEHLQILAYLGVTRAVVALTKSDLIETDESAAIASVREHLLESPFADAPVVPTSIITGQGLDELKTTLASVLSATPPPRDIGKPRLPVDRVFTLHGIGTVVTGTLTGGALRRGQAVVVQPGGRTTRVRSIQSHNCDVNASGPGARTALNLPDIQAAGETREADGVRRGSVITLPEFGGVSTTLDVVLEKSSRLAEAKTSAARPLQDGAVVRVHLGSGNFPARVLFPDNAELLPGRRLIAQLRTEAPVFAFVGDRFIVRDWSEQTTLAGGVVLDTEASRKNLRGESRLRFLGDRAQAPHDIQVLIRSQLARDGAVRRPALLLQSRFSAAEIADAVEHLVKERKVVSLAHDWTADQEWWDTLKQRAGGAIEAEHRAHPERSGLALSELRSKLQPEFPAPELFDVLVADLCQHDFTQAGAALRRTTHRRALPSHLEAAGAKVRAALAARPFETPSRKALAPDALTQQALRFFLQTGEAVELGEEVVLLAENYKRAADIIKNFLRARGSATAGELRQALATNRRVIIPLLEGLDRDGVTLRQGEKRVLRKPS